MQLHRAEPVSSSSFDICRSGRPRSSQQEPLLRFQFRSEQEWRVTRLSLMRWHRWLLSWKMLRRRRYLRLLVVEL